MSIKTNYKQYFDITFVYCKNSLIKKVIKGTKVSHYTLYTSCTLSDGRLVLYADQVFGTDINKELDNISKILQQEICGVRAIPRTGRPYEYELGKIKVSKSKLILGGCFDV